LGRYHVTVQTQAHPYVILVAHTDPRNIYVINGLEIGGEITPCQITIYPDGHAELIEE
jgi:hypothetical protein